MISQIELVSAIMKHIEKQGESHANTRQMNAIIEAANLIVNEFSRPHQEAVANSSLEQWLASDDTGMSSLFMAHVLAPHIGKRAQRPKYGVSFPFDPDDFGRCHRLLAAVPQFRAHLEEMSKHGAVWAAYVKHWDHMTHLFVMEHYRDLYNFMAKIQKEAETPEQAGEVR